ncbi:MAG: peptide-methionine (S)-S-oxide reductase [Gallionellales bacterium 35-53-114]|jgi:peptide-methionine (S)-S-oxide reductase|nr:MAG: peptide-methionine (S)-S-oxide reductase [Gallionellales bacterium 35-53-114]OYZ65195.1 MAG: peptide-methionine (S)-S-oxide reductase [Gallionellales bacterium 24-53-125]OZB08101.1 MAG: peptide-methionine (S)-S-oxide reductase [Gallionellales bacterium 39-52-133]HQS58021.1 peptide-methionine (S)-S-oxide reductase MsrA [Gallionellaceae bacterium]HQS73577.1 peptide-methionine (S)-S-oxide reductase MsrA [Gallionellaceae bacterium]
MSDKQIATLAGGCFWCLEAVYEQMRGVEKVVSGYIAGEKPDPTYEEVCSGNSGHAEAVQISFDPAQVSYGELLSVFFTIHDPTTLNRQGNDKGTQYRSAIYYHNEDQRAEAAELMLELRKQHIFPAPLVTELVAASTFYPAESYHQHYYANHPEQGYCQFVVAPKLKKFKEHFAAKMK